MSTAQAPSQTVIRSGRSEYAAEVDDGVMRVRGVRYGERLDGSDRFSLLADPSPKRPQAPPTVFPQSPGALDWLLGPALSQLPQDEDSFLLDVWAPVGAQDAPVLVFLPGGAFISGAGNVRWYDGAALARKTGFIVVTVAYRLGALALFGGPDAPLNLSASDILQALRWVHRNIAAFGGDPGSVTLAGESAGAWYAYVLSLAPRARGLFQRTVLLSLPWQTPLNPGQYRERFDTFTAALAAPAGLRTAPVEAILRAQRATSKAYAGRGLGLAPAADDDLVPAWAFEFELAAAELHVGALLLCSSEDEARAFLHAVPESAVGHGELCGYLAAHFEDPDAACRWIDAKLPEASDHARLTEAMSLHEFRLAATELATQARTAGIPATLVRFAVPTRAEGGGTPHGFVLPFFFGNRPQWADAPMLEGFPQDSFETVSDELRALLQGFVADGHPSAGDGSKVREFDPLLPVTYRITEAAAGPAAVEPDLCPRR
jgi:para-nitrobenzyl esterase